MTKKSEETRLPVACSLSAPELRARARAVRDGLARYITAVKELENGVAFRLAPLGEVLDEAEAFIGFERQCCAFATFELRRDEAEDALWVEISGPEGTRAFFEELLPTREERSE